MDEFLMDAFYFLSVSDSACMICHLYNKGSPSTCALAAAVLPW